MDDSTGKWEYDKSNLTGCACLMIGLGSQQEKLCNIYNCDCVSQTVPPT